MQLHRELLELGSLDQQGRRDVEARYGVTLEEQDGTKQAPRPRLAIREEYGTGVEGLELSPLWGTRARAFANVVLAAIQPAGIALPLWAALQWNMPVSLAVTIASLVCTASIAFALLASGAGFTINRKSVVLNGGLVEDVLEITRQISRVKIHTGEGTEEFIAHSSITDRLGRGDPVVYAYVPGSSGSRDSQIGDKQDSTAARMLRVATIDTD